MTDDDRRDEPIPVDPEFPPLIPVFTDSTAATTNYVLFLKTSSGTTTTFCGTD